MTRKVGSVSPSFLECVLSVPPSLGVVPFGLSEPRSRDGEAKPLTCENQGIGPDRVEHLARLPPTLVGVVFDQEFRKAKCSIATCVPFGREEHGRPEVGLSRRSVTLARIQFTQVLVCHDYVARPGIGLDQTNEKLTSSPRFRVAAVMHKREALDAKVLRPVRRARTAESFLELFLGANVPLRTTKPLLSHARKVRRLLRRHSRTLVQAVASSLTVRCAGSASVLPPLDHAVELLPRLALLA